MKHLNLIHFSDIYVKLSVKTRSVPCFVFIDYLIIDHQQEFIKASKEETEPLADLRSASAAPPSDSQRHTVWLPTLKTQQPQEVVLRHQQCQKQTWRRWLPALFLLNCSTVISLALSLVCRNGSSNITAVHMWHHKNTLISLLPNQYTQIN